MTGPPASLLVKSSNRSANTTPKIPVLQRPSKTSGPGWGYYNAFLKNCAISSALLPLRSYAESKEFLCVNIMHTGQMDISVHPQFKVESVGREKVGNHKSVVDLSLGTYAKTERMGKIELENDFFGALSYVVLTVFNDAKGDPATVYSFSKPFSIDKRTAGANMLQLD
ncbi:hypothetical protein PM082_013818 [Marasmius tenuissimus]|nr:hypothetical protein PM082_013818 [Marasmius tenuissimus]